MEHHPERRTLVNEPTKRRIITSTAHDEVKRVASLASHKGRMRQGAYIAEGVRVCTTLIAAGALPRVLYATEKMCQCGLFEALALHADIVCVADHVMKKMSAAHTPSGVLGVFPISRRPSHECLKPGLVLAEIADPGNMGTLMRTAAALNFACVVIVGGADPWSPKVVQASSGCIAFLSIFSLTWSELVEAKNAADFRLVALVVKGGKNPQELSYDRALLVVGGEARGIPQEWISDCDEFLSLPMPGPAESLNAAVAGSIALYMARRERPQNGVCDEK